MSLSAQKDFIKIFQDLHLKRLRVIFLVSSKYTVVRQGHFSSYIFDLRGVWSFHNQKKVFKYFELSWISCLTSKN